MTGPAPVAGPTPRPDPTRSRNAATVLLRNWRGSYTVPASGLYPHQWSWDSAFIAIGLRHLSPRRAQQELESLLRAQWADGRVPQIVFADDRDDDYSPGPLFWRSEAIPGSPATPTAALIQPPVHAWAALLVHRSDPDESRRRRFLERAYPRLVAWHRYLRARRGAASGLAFLVHPWETGMDNSPSWDGPLAVLPETDAADIDRPDLLHADAAERPSNAEYGRYLYLAARYRDALASDSPDSAPFRVVDPATNALWARSELSLAEIADLVGRDPAPHVAEAGRVTDALETLWNPGLGCYTARDDVAGTSLDVRTIGGLIPLILPGIARATELLATLDGEHFALGDGVMIPSYDRSAPDFDGSLYWRGPSWFNTAWLVAAGLEQHGRSDAAAAVRREIAQRAAPSGYAEYLDPVTAQPHGTRDFSWTAALAADAALSTRAVGE